MSKVSVIIPTFNHGHFVRQAIESVLEQMNADYEILVIDDGSRDNTAERLKDLIDQSKIRYYYQNNRGLSAARNKGIELAQGDFLKFLDSDDRLSPWQLALQVHDLVKNDSQISISGFSWFYPDGAEIMKFVRLENDPLASFVESNKAPVHAFLVKKRDVEKGGYFDESLTACEDYDLWLRLILNGAKISIVNYVGCRYRFLMTSMSEDTEKMFKNKSKVVERLNAALLQNLTLLTEPVIDKLIRSNTKLIHQCLARGYSIQDYLPSTIKMLEFIYEKRFAGLKKMALNFLGEERFIRLQYSKYKFLDRNYQHDLINDEILYRRKRRRQFQ